MNFAPFEAWLRDHGITEQRHLDAYKQIAAALLAAHHVERLLPKHLDAYLAEKAEAGATAKELARIKSVGDALLKFQRTASVVAPAPLAPTAPSASAAPRTPAAKSTDVSDDGPPRMEHAPGAPAGGAFAGVPWARVAGIFFALAMTIFIVKATARRNQATLATAAATDARAWAVPNRVPGPMATVLAAQVKDLRVVVARTDQRGDQAEVSVFVVLLDATGRAVSADGEVALRYQVGDQQADGVYALPANAFIILTPPGESEPVLGIRASHVLLPAAILKGQVFSVDVTFDRRLHRVARQAF